MQHLTSFALTLAEQGLCPDVAIRRGIRHLLKHRLREIGSGDARTATLQETHFIEQMRRAPSQWFRKRRMINITKSQSSSSGRFSART